ncbi:MAG: EamA family transporter [Methylobacterium sp.]|nr:EamA family transporter [Methylobacterium sp.]
MKPWLVDAFIAMTFAGITTVIAKQGLVGVSAELGIGVRTVFVFFFVMAFVLFAVPLAEVKAIDSASLGWLAISAFTTAVSWVYFYKALKHGDVATVALVDKGSVLVAVILAWLFLKEVLTLRLVLGAALIVAGLLLISRK